MYLSDLRFFSLEQRRHPAQRLNRLRPREEDIWEWNDALNYLTDAPLKDMALAAKKHLFSLLSQPCSAGIDKAT